MENKELECIEEIIGVIKKYDFDFSEVEARKKIEVVKVKRSPLWFIKRINGILKNANEENAEMKVDALMKFLKKES